MNQVLDPSRRYSQEGLEGQRQATACNPGCLSRRAYLPQVEPPVHPGGRARGRHT